MVEYIEREAAMDIFGDVPMWQGYYEPYPWEVHCALVGVVKLVKEEISKIPAADVAPVVHGRWEIGNQFCPVCGKDKFAGLDADIWCDWLPDYCPNCGARMDGGADNETD